MSARRRFPSLRSFVLLLLPVALLVGAALAYGAGATRVVIDYVDVSTAPVFRLYTDFRNAADRPIRNLAASDVTILLDGEPYGDEIGITQFKKSEESVAFVLLVNNYRGYGPVFEQQKKGLQAFVRGMRSRDVASIVAYSDKVVPLVDWTSDKDELLQALGTVPPPEKPKEVFIDAVIAALDRFPDPDENPSFPRRRAIIMMSDALDQGLADKAYLANRIKRDLAPKAKALMVKFYGLGYSIESTDGLRLMSMLAKNFGGHFVEIRESELNRLSNFFTNILDVIYGQYVISFVTDGLDHEEMHTVQVNINYKGKSIESVPVEFKPPEVPGMLPWWGWLLVILGGVLGLVLLIGIIVAIVKRKKPEAADDGDDDDDDATGDKACPVCGEEMYPEDKVCEVCLGQPHVAELSVVGGAWDGFIYIINAEITSIGSREGDILIEDATVSGKHAGIKMDDLKFELADFGSTNGTYVNGKRITKQFLKDGDSVKFGNIDMKFKLT